MPSGTASVEPRHASASAPHGREPESGISPEHINGYQSFRMCFGSQRMGTALPPLLANANFVS